MRLPEAPNRFAAAIRAYRQQQGLRTEELAVQVGLSESIISIVENGARFPSMQTVRILANTIGFTAQELGELLMRWRIARVVDHARTDLDGPEGTAEAGGGAPSRDADRDHGRGVHLGAGGAARHRDPGTAEDRDVLPVDGAGAGRGGALR